MKIKQIVGETTGAPVGTVSTAPDANGKIKIKTPTGTEIETNQDALLPGAKPGTVQMKPDAAGDALKPGTQVVSAEAMDDDDLGRIKSLAGMKEQDPNPAPGAPAPQAAAPTQQPTPQPAPTAAEDDDGPVPPIESKEDFVKFFLERNPEYTKPENKAMLDKLVAVDTDGTVDLEVTMANMMKIFANELAPGFVEMFEHLGKIIEEAIADPEFAQLTPQEQADLKDALVDIKKKLPEMKQTVANIQSQTPELDAVVAQRKAAGMKNFGMPKAPVQQPTAPMEELGRIKELAGVKNEEITDLGDGALKPGTQVVSAEAMDDDTYGQTPPPMPDISGLQPNQTKDLGNGKKVTLKQDGTVSHSGGFGEYIYDKTGKVIKYNSPSFSGLSKSTDLTTNNTTTRYNAGGLSTSQQVDAQGKPIKSTANYDLGVAKIDAELDHKSGITSKAITTPGMDPNEFLPTSSIAAAKGVDPKKFAKFQQQNPTAVKESPDLTAMLRIAGLR